MEIKKKNDKHLDIKLKEVVDKKVVDKNKWVIKMKYRNIVIIICWVIIEQNRKVFSNF